MLTSEQKKEMFPNHRDLTMKIGGTITTWKKEFYYTEVTDSMKLHLFPLNWQYHKKQENEKIICRFTDEDWNIQFPKLGYLNVEGTCFYMSRSPARTNKIAPSLNSFSAFSPDGKKARFSLRDASSLDHKALNEFFHGQTEIKFPEAIKKLDNASQKSIALSPELCLYKDSMGVVKAVYRNTVVGWLAKSKKPKIIIPESHSKNKRIALISKFLSMETEVLKDV